MSEGRWKFMPYLTIISIVVAIVVGIGGLVLGIWNRVEQWREKQVRKPHFTADVGPPDSDGWRPLKLIVHNPGECAFRVETIKIARGSLAPVLEPGPGVAPYGGVGTTPNKSLAGQTISALWTIDRGHTVSRTIFCKPASDPLAFSIRVTAREISATRRRFHMQADNR